MFYAKPTDTRPAPAVVPKIPASPALYVAGALTQIAGLLAASFQIGEPGFAYFTIAITIVGMATAFFLRHFGVPARYLKGGTFVLGLVFLYALRGAGFFGAIVPPEAQGSQEILLVSALSFTATFCSFLLVTDEAVVFTGVWAIAIIGLTGTVDINRPLIGCFALFLLAASFLLVHQNALAQGQKPNAPTASSLRLLRTQAIMAVCAWFTAITLGFFIAIPIQMVGRNLSLSTIIQKLRVPATAGTRLQGAAHLIFDNLAQFNIGVGPVDDDPVERMTVLSDRPEYWRGRVYDQYTGHAWVSSNQQQTRIVVTPVPGTEREDNFNVFDIPPGVNSEPPRKRTTRLRFRFNVNAGSFGPLYHAAEPVRVFAPLETLSVRPDRTMGVGRNSSGIPGEWEVECDVPEARPADLRSSPRRYPTDITLLYLNQGVTDDALQTLADEAVGNFTDPYTRAKAIQRFVAGRCIYTRDARAVPKNRDAVEFFLNDSREGYCDLYASAMAVLCRYAGIPARVATGFAPGTPSEDALPPGEKRTRYSLKGSDLHAWAEVYFTDYGWIRFDPTEDTGGVATPTQTPQPVENISAWKRLLQRDRVPLGFVGVGILGLLFVLGNELGGKTRHRVGGGKQKPSPEWRNAQEVTQFYRRGVREIERKERRKRAETDTTGQYLRAVRDRLGPGIDTAFAPLTLLAEQALYGPQAIGQKEVNDAQKHFDQLRLALRHVSPPKEKTDAPRS